MTPRVTLGGCNSGLHYVEINNTTIGELSTADLIAIADAIVRELSEDGGSVFGLRDDKGWDGPAQTLVDVSWPASRGTTASQLTAMHLEAEQ
jgi:hypothetical protein